MYSQGQTESELRLVDEIGEFDTLAELVQQHSLILEEVCSLHLRLLYRRPGHALLSLWEHHRDHKLD